MPKLKQTVSPKARLTDVQLTALNEKAKLYEDLRWQFKELEGRMRDTRADLLFMLEKNGGEPIDLKEYTLTKVKSKSVHMDEDVLLELGVKPRVIREAKERGTKEYEYPSIRKKGDK